MKDEVRKLSEAYGFNLSEEEIELIARRAQAAHELFQPLYEVDIGAATPVLKLEQREQQ